MSIYDAQTGAQIVEVQGGGGGGGGNVVITNTTTSPGNVQIASLYYPSSTANNTAAQLAAGATFTGGIETVLSLQAAQIQAVCDQPYTVVVNQYIDAAGTQKSGSRTFTRLAGQPMNVNILLPGNYFQLTLTNNGASTTTTLTVATTFGVMDSVDDTGRITVITPLAKLTAIGQQLVTSTPTALPSAATLNGIVLSAAPTNAGTVLFGNSSLTNVYNGTGTGDALQPGLPRSAACENTNQIFVCLAAGNTSTTDFVSWSGN